MSHEKTQLDSRDVQAEKPGIEPYETPIIELLGNVRSILRGAVGPSVDASSGQLNDIPQG